MELNRAKKCARWALFLGAAGVAGWFAVYAFLVLAGQMKPRETSGPYYRLWYALIGSTGTWATHLLAAFLSAYLLTPYFRTRWVVIPLSSSIGLAVVWGLVMLDVGKVLYLGAPSYWMWNVSRIVDLSVLLEFPKEYFTSFFVAWAAPLGLAWWTVRVRTRRAETGQANVPA